MLSMKNVVQFSIKRLSYKLQIGKKAMRFLIVDDEANNRILLERILSPYSECDMAVNGVEAMEAYFLAFDEGKPYDLICLDIMMPEMDGLEVLKTIRKKEKEMGFSSLEEVKIIMITGLDTPKDVLDAYFRGGCTDYLVKPLDSNKLLDLIRDYGLI